MALTYTPAPSLGTLLPAFDLPTVDGQRFGSAQLAKNQPTALVVMFICGHCPYVLAVEDRLIALSRECGDKAQFVGICANNDDPADQPAALLKRWREKNYGFPYLLDTTQEVARAFGAVCTPDIFVYDQNRRLRYRGRVDDAWKNPAQVRRQDLRVALQRLMAGHEVDPEQIPSMGCSIKWRPA